MSVVVCNLLCVFALFGVHCSFFVMCFFFFISFFFFVLLLYSLSLLLFFCFVLLFVDTLVLCYCFFFFFFKQKTAYELRISDWSSDVCSSDLGAGGFRNRVAAYRQQYDVSFGDTLHVIADQPDFLASGDAKTIAGEVERVGAGLVVIDTLAQVTPGGDENSAVDMGKAIRKCRQISETTGAMVLLVHHAGKDVARGARGWSGIRAAADVEIEVSLHKSGVRVAKLTQQKEGQDGLAYGFTLETVTIGQEEDGDRRRGE